MKIKILLFFGVFILFFFPFQPKALGQALLSEVFHRGNLIESDYFGLEFQNMQMNWVRTPPTVYFLFETDIFAPAYLSTEADGVYLFLKGQTLDDSRIGNLGAT